MEDLVQLLQAAHFRVLSADEWATAQQENFTVRGFLRAKTPGNPEGEKP